MYSYSIIGLARNWRPDLVPTIMKWVESVPESEWALFDHFRVGGNGQFVAEFHRRPDRGGPPRTITHRFDHTFHYIETDISILDADSPQPYDPDHNVFLSNVVG